MAVLGNEIRNEINVIETAIRDAGSTEALHAVVDALKEVARAVDSLEEKLDSLMKK